MFKSLDLKKHKLSPEEGTNLDALNIFLSQFSSVNNQLSEIQKYSLIRLLLIRATRGRAHALGKPSRGQRT